MKFVPYEPFELSLSISAEALTKALADRFAPSVTKASGYMVYVSKDKPPVFWYIRRDRLMMGVAGSFRENVPMLRCKLIPEERGVVLRGEFTPAFGLPALWFGMAVGLGGAAILLGVLLFTPIAASEVPSVLFGIAVFLGFVAFYWYINVAPFWRKVGLTKQTAIRQLKALANRPR